MASLKHIFAPLPVTTRGENLHLQTDPKNEKLIYCGGPAVIIRDLRDPSICYTYTEHAKAPTAACFAPSGFYVCSGDMGGKVRIWDTTQETHLCKCEFDVLGGAIKDICWSPDSKRILVVGAGRNKRTHCFMWDSGTSCGALATHSKDVNAVAHSPIRPFRAVTASEDFSVRFHTGVPYKCDKIFDNHTNFVNSVRYNPSGANFCSVSSDKRALLYDGKTGEVIGEFKDGETAHKGGIMAVSYNPGGTQLMTASADKTVKLWDIEENKFISTINIGQELEDQQLGCIWAGDYKISVSLSGCFNYLDFSSNQIIQVVKGHQKSIETMEISGKDIVTTSFDGRASVWNSTSGDANYLNAACHKNKVTDTKILGDSVVSVDIDNKVLRTSLSTGKAGKTSSVPSNAASLSVHDPSGIEIYACDQELVLMKNGDSVQNFKLEYTPFGCAISPCGTVLAVGAKDDHKLYLYDLDIASGSITLKSSEPKVINLSAACTEINFSPDGAFLAGAMCGRNITLLDANNNFKSIVTCVSAQSKTLTCSFSHDSKFLALAGIDSNILVFNVTKPMDSPIKILRAHPLATINKVRWLNTQEIDNYTIASTGSDFQVRIHEVNI